MTDHQHYEELTALAAGGHLSEEESADLLAHLQVCAKCKDDARAYRDLVVSGLPLTRDAVTAERETADSRAPAGARERFLRRAMSEGVRFSSDVHVEDEPARAKRFPGYRLVAGLAAAAAVIAALYVPQLARQGSVGTAAQRELDQVKRENAQLTERLTARDTELAAQQELLRKVRSELDTAVKTVAGLRRDNQLKGQRLGQSTVQTAQLVDELENRDKQLALATEEINRINQLRVTDRAALDSHRMRLREISNQLRIADATIEMERQLSAAGRDLRELMLARQLRVVDVRDTDASGRPNQAFARVFISEGQSIRIFAFDLIQGREAGPGRFQVWGEQLGNSSSLRNLGTLEVDDRRQNRWSLTLQNADAVKNISSVFVTAANRGGAPDGPRLLYVHLGQAGLP
jgi:hypothetical protein